MVVTIGYTVCYQSLLQDHWLSPLQDGPGCCYIYHHYRIISRTIGYCHRGQALVSSMGDSLGGEAIVVDSEIELV